MQTQDNRHGPTFSHPASLQFPSSSRSNLVIDSLKPKSVRWVRILFFLIIGVLFLLTFSISDGVVQYPFVHSNFCPDEKYDGNDYCRKGFVLNTTSQDYFPSFAVFPRRMSKKNQFFTIDVEPLLKSRALSGISKLDLKLEYATKVFELQEDKLTMKELLHEGPPHNINFKCAMEDGLAVCEKKTLVEMDQIHHENYLIVIKVKNAEQLQYKVKTFLAHVNTIDKDATNFLLVLRHFCLCISIGFAIYYWLNLRTMGQEKLVFEQKYIRVLGILLLLFNNPIYASPILHPNFMSAVLSPISTITFVCALLLFWISALQRVYRESTQVKYSALSFTKLVYIFFLWLSSSVGYYFWKREYWKDPSFILPHEYEEIFTAFKMTIVLLFGIGLVWISYKSIQILRIYKNLSQRDKIFFTFSCSFIFCILIFMLTGSIDVYNLNGTKILLPFSLTNIYIWFLQALYSPSGKRFEASVSSIRLAKKVQEYEMFDGSSENKDEYADDEEVGNPNGFSFSLVIKTSK